LVFLPIAPWLPLPRFATKAPLGAQGSGLWAPPRGVNRGYGLWDMSYGLWAIGYGL
jgi:hypothetical protein